MGKNGGSRVPVYQCTLAVIVIVFVIIRYIALYMASFQIGSSCSLLLFRLGDKLFFSVVGWHVPTSHQDSQLWVY